MKPTSDRASKRGRAGALLLLMLLVLSFLLTACSGGAETPKEQKSHVLNGIATVDEKYTKDMNPFSSTANPGVSSLIYEPLIFTNIMDNSLTPWLASGYSFSKDLGTLTLTLRKGVMWSDGIPFTANDVLFTFRLLKKYPSMDVNNLWAYLANVEAPDQYTVVLSFARPYPPLLWSVGKTTPVPEHVFSRVADPRPGHFINESPVGTGPYLLKSFDPYLVQYVKNTRYWQADKAQISEVRFHVLKNNNEAWEGVASGRYDWSGIFPSGDINATYVKKDPAHNHYWFAPYANLMLFVNHERAPFNILPIRQAISLALDRERMFKDAEGGYEPVASPTAVVLPGHKKFLDPQYANLKFSRDLDQAKSLLAAQGYRAGADGILQSSLGTRLSFNLVVPADWSDWVEVCKIIQDNLKAVGIEVKLNGLSVQKYYEARSLGDFDMLLGTTTPSPHPFYMYDMLLNSSQVPPVGEAAVSNYERWRDAETNELLNQYAGTIDPKVQQQALNGLQRIMVEKLPAIPLLYAAMWFEYNDKRFTGWPNEKNPYASAQVTDSDNIMVILNLKPVS
ncbi:peptide/nickel transport system substrate-binding protein [Thermosporothrix hazakensis]|jgi:peptide/nickel transport system substrate-binding protein|uniref:Peptide/nickel transport system substrate-binding protein n=2 Tax=Thermosporothrix TaxID=768650 RepID=A0A326UF15_THEHA|nr:ABC transporter substrate-binding protein [Thermosporothrix hazakensis]PZW36515.1 peptide/nickel transport system substrate-binding protein [Thermosporothrix hazakensis]BBH88981.1 peptide ABC transporter substrate-binding protein [Thermosporothrix sp. COM3]GCE47167.1 peptide ABC transporter substrate-binding protein [Thermosporothrix hazakensis]